MVYGLMVSRTMLCDLKPFYGVVHNEELRDYDWWGFSDIDLVYAELGKFVNEENMKGHDILTTHVDRVAGHFTIIRRKSKYNDIAFRIKGWREMLTDDKNHGIDEGDFSGVSCFLQAKMLLLLANAPSACLFGIRGPLNVAKGR